MHLEHAGHDVLPRGVQSDRSSSTSNDATRRRHMNMIGSYETIYICITISEGVEFSFHSRLHKNDFRSSGLSRPLPVQRGGRGLLGSLRAGPGSNGPDQRESRVLAQGRHFVSIASPSWKICICSSPRGWNL